MYDHVFEVSIELRKTKFWYKLWLGVRQASRCNNTCRSVRDGSRIPNVEQLECMEQHPFLHVVINLLIGPKAWGSIDLPEKRKEKQSKNNWVFFASCRYFFHFHCKSEVRNWVRMLYRTGASMQGYRREAGMGDGRYMTPFKGTLAVLALIWA